MIDLSDVSLDFRARTAGTSFTRRSGGQSLMKPSDGDLHRGAGFSVVVLMKVDEKGKPRFYSLFALPQAASASFFLFGRFDHSQ
jgi:hypothetical protein